MVKNILIGLSFVMASVVSVSVNASTIDFGMIATTPGTISYAGGAASLIGTNIEVDNVVGIDTPLNSGGTPTICESCVLSFTTGASTGNWNFSGGGTISIIGGVSAAGIAPGTTLLTGTFESASIIDIGGNLFDFKIAGAGFTDTKDDDLLTYFGITSNDFVGGLNLSFDMVGAPVVGSAFTSDSLYSGDIVNKVVPIPAAVWLFGTGLLGLVGVARRRV